MPVTRFRSSPVSKYRISIQCCRHRLSPFIRCLAVALSWVSLAFITAKWNQHGMAYVSILFICGVRIPPLWLSFRQFSFIPHTQIFILTHLNAQDYCPLTQAVVNSYDSDDMLHSPSGFPSRISCRIIGCDFSSPDTFTYRLLKAVSCKYHVANLYCAGDFWAHAVAGDCFPSIFEKCL